MSRRIVASDEPVSSTISGTVTTGFSWTADRMIRWRSFSCIAPPGQDIYAVKTRSVNHFQSNNFIVQCNMINLIVSD